jgi:hypothetical protein
MNEAADMVKELRIYCEALRVGIEMLTGRPETAASLAVSNAGKTATPD